MTKPADGAAPVVHIHFEVDGLYFAEATRQASTLAPLEATYLAKRKETENLNRKIRDIEARHGGDSAAAYDEAERHVIQLVDNAFVQLDAAARPLAGTSATIQILSAACLEAHINVRAAETLVGSLYDEFERASLGGKWLLYPAIRNLAGLDAGGTVLRGVHDLAKRRNALVHPKRQRSENTVGFQTPDFLERSHLTGEAARKALTAVQQAVTALAIAEGRPVPAWLKGTFWSLFRHDWSHQSD
jgi:hypothetical protein